MHIAARARRRASSWSMIRAARSCLFPTVVGRFCGVPTIRFLGRSADLVRGRAGLADRDARPLRICMALAYGSGGGARYSASHGPRRCAGRTVSQDRYLNDRDDRRAVHRPQCRFEPRQFAMRAGSGDIAAVWRSAESWNYRCSPARKPSRYWPRRSTTSVRGLPNETTVAPFSATRTGKTRSLRLAQCASPGFQLVAVQLCVGGAPAAIEIAFSDGRRWCSFLGAITPNSRGVGPAMSRSQIQSPPAPPPTTQSTICSHHRNRSNARSRPGRVSVNNHIKAIGVRGRLVLAATRLAPQIKSQVMRLPPRPRGTIVRWVRALTST